MSRAGFGVVIAAVVALAACSAGSASEGDESSLVAKKLDESKVTVPVPSDAAAPVRDACTEAKSADRKTEVCRRWRCASQGIVAATWDGDGATCSAGAIDGDARSRAQELVDTYRFLAGVPPVAQEARWEPAAQACALVAHANAALSHHPPESWKCWSDLAAKTSAVSLIANRSAAVAVPAFIEDPGNETTMVHRRWLLAEELTRIAHGSTSKFACIVVVGSELDASDDHEAVEAIVSAPDFRGWVAWPPPGPVPLEAITRDKLDTTGWTVQSSTVDLDGATVTVTRDGKRLAVDVVKLERGAGSQSALKITPKGWTTEAGKTYAVHVQRGKLAIDYTVEPFACE